MTKVDLITGFLGSGKTTFIRKYVEYLASKGENICILENSYNYKIHHTFHFSLP